MEEHVRNIAAFPLGIPLLAGPGAITATVLLAGQAGGRAVPLAILIGVIVVVAAACLVTFLVAERIGKLLGITGNVVLSRLLGVILAALAVQYVIDGVRAVFGVMTEAMAPNTTACMMRPGTKVNAPAITSPPTKMLIIAQRWLRHAMPAARAAPRAAASPA